MKHIMIDIENMMNGFGQRVPKETTWPAERSLRELRIKLLMEEFNEYIHAEMDNDIVEITDALADLIVIAVGTALSYGIPFDKIWDEVHKTNMAKFDPVTGKVKKRADGKVIKPEGWKGPDIRGILYE